MSPDKADEPSCYLDAQRLEGFRRRHADDPDTHYLLTKLYLVQHVAEARLKSIDEVRDRLTAATAEAAHRHDESREHTAKLLERRELGIAIAGIVDCIRRWRAAAKTHERAAVLDPVEAPASFAWAYALREAANEAANVLRKGQFPAELKPRPVRQIKPASKADEALDL